MSACATYSGILFSRKPCGQAGVLTCERCRNSVCKQHVRPQSRGPFLCPSCDAYANDDDWGYSNNDHRWHYRDRSRSDGDLRPAAAAGAAGAAGVAAGDLADEDKAGLSTGAWHGPDGTGSAESGDGASWQGDGSDGTDGADGASDDGDFDAS